MKYYRFYIFIIFLSSSLTSIGQEIILKNRISINAFSIKFVNNNIDYIYSDNTINLFNGLSYNREYKKIVIRYSLNFIVSKKQVSSTGPDSYYGKEYNYIWALSSGIQKDYKFNKFNTFFGIDLYSNLIIKKIDFNGGFDGNGLSEKNYDNWLGISPIIGIRYNITSHISISIETSYNIELIVFSTQKDDTFNKTQNYLNPINALNFSYRF